MLEFLFGSEPVKHIAATQKQKRAAMLQSRRMGYSRTRELPQKDLLLIAFDGRCQASGHGGYTLFSSVRRYEVNPKGGCERRTSDVLYNV